MAMGRVHLSWAGWETLGSGWGIQRPIAPAVGGLERRVLAPGRSIQSGSAFADVDTVGPVGDVC